MVIYFRYLSNIKIISLRVLYVIDFLLAAFPTSYQVSGKFMFKLRMNVARQSGLLNDEINILVGWRVLENKPVIHTRCCFSD